TAPTVALNVGHWHFYGMWVLGGLVSMVGALCYVEMATAFPDSGGDYSFLRKAYGAEVGLLFAWSRFSIMHTGWIALMAFMFADYATALLALGPLGHTLFAVGTVAALIGLNLMHVRLGFITQAGLIGLVTAGFAAVVIAALKLGLAHQLPAAIATAPAHVPSLSQFSGALMAGLGQAGLAQSPAPAADLLGRAFGPAGKTLIVAVVGVSAIASINSTLIVGARTTYAAARDTPALAAFGRWEAVRGVPARAVLAEGGFAILLVVAGSFAASGFSAMVDYMTPVYWFFIVLSMGALMILRRRFPDAERPVRTPLYPLFPAAFLLIALYMFVASLFDLGVGALYGAGVMLAGVAALALLRLRRPRAVGANRALSPPERIRHPP